MILNLDVTLRYDFQLALLRVRVLGDERTGDDARAYIRIISP
ncbi:MAG TPA: hypothetical protein VN777_08075 [Terriglobales bacterium]|nr:hypothetical protein [Terriglobales bacterium]